MDAQQFLAEFGHIANAPEGVGRLRELVLLLAVQGKLVQHLLDNPMSEEKIRAEQEQALRELQIRSHPETTEVSENDLPFRLPLSWNRVRLGDLAYSCPTSYGADPSPGLVKAGVVKVGNIDNEGGFKGNFSDRGFAADEVAALLARKGDLMVVKSSGSSENVHSGKTALCTAEHDGKIVASNFVLRLRLTGTSAAPEYIWRVLTSRYSRAWVEKTVQTMTYPNLKWSDFAQLPIPLPPLAEQERIVAKADELMAVCDKLEAQQQDRRKLQNALRQSTLQAVASAQSALNLQTTWTRLSENFGRLFSEPQDVVELRNLILDLAVHGLLVEQSTSDAPVSQWVSSIAVKKASLVKIKLIAKQTAFADLDESEYPFPLPKGWMFVRLGQITNKIGSGSTPRGGREVYVKEGIPFLRSQNVWNDGLRLSDVAYIAPEMHERMLGTAVLGDDILLNITGASLGRCALVPSDFGDANVSQHVTIIRPADPQVREYLHLCLLSPYAQAMIWGRQVGMAREGLSKKVLEQFEIPLPPIAEQKRIVARVAKLMRYCDELEAHLKDANKIAERLAAAAIASLTGISIEQEEDERVKIPQTELIAPLRLGQTPDIKAQAPLAALLARHNSEMSAKDLWQRFGGEIDAFYAQLKTEVAHGWIQEPEPAQMREVQAASEGA